MLRMSMRAQRAADSEQPPKNPYGNQQEVVLQNMHLVCDSPSNEVKIYSLGEDQLQIAVDSQLLVEILRIPPVTRIRRSYLKRSLSDVVAKQHELAQRLVPLDEKSIGSWPLIAQLKIQLAVLDWVLGLKDELDPN